MTMARMGYSEATLLDFGVGGRNQKGLVMK